MAVVPKNVEQVVLKAFRKFKTGYESLKEKQLAFIIGILEYENVLSVCGPDLKKSTSLLRRRICRMLSTFRLTLKAVIRSFCAYLKDITRLSVI